MKRVITGQDEDGKSVFIAVGEPPNGKAFESGTKITYCWQTQGSPVVLDEHNDPTVAMTNDFLPTPDGTTFVIAQFPGNSLGQMHTTATIDYVTILSGEVWLVLDNEAEILLTPGDTVIQNGTNHAWRVSSPNPCMLSVVLMGAIPNSNSLARRKGD